jgi:hypothetical protein
MYFSLIDERVRVILCKLQLAALIFQRLTKTHFVSLFPMDNFQKSRHDSIEDDKMF